MATGNMRMSERAVLNKATVTLTIERPAVHRLFYWIGLRCCALGMRLMGIGDYRIEDTSDD